MEAVVAQGMKDGAVGLSTGLIYVPGTYAKTDEIVALARVAALYGGLYATHMRNEGDKVADAIRESIQIGEQAGLPVEISHFKISNKKLWGQTPMTLGLVRGLLTMTLFVAFISVLVWAWSKQRRTEDEAAARLPLADDLQPTRSDVT